MNFYPTLNDFVDLGILAGIYFGYLRETWMRMGRKQFILRTVFYWYVAAVLYLTIMPFVIPLFFGHGSFEPANFELFTDVLAHRPSAYVQLFLNALMLFPFGFLLGWIKPLKIWQLTLCGFALSLSIECLQYAVADGRIFDVTDLLMNTIGALIGAITYRLFQTCCRKIIK